MLSTIFISAIVLSIIALLFDWDGKRKNKRYMESLDKRFGKPYQDPKFFFNNDKTSTAG